MPNPENLIGQGFHTNPERINREGKTRGTKNISTILMQLLELYVNDPDNEGQKITNAELLAIRLKKLSGSDNENISLKAIEQILDRTEGKAKQTVDVNSNVHLTDRPINFE